MKLQKYHLVLERTAGIEPASSAWKAEVLPLYDIRKIGRDDWIRTNGLPLRRGSLYPTELRPDIETGFYSPFRWIDIINTPQFAQVLFSKKTNKNNN